MTTATVSRKVTRGEELVAIPRREYEQFTRWQEMHEKVFTSTRAEKNDLKKARQDYRAGKFITAHGLKQKMGITR